MSHLWKLSAVLSLGLLPLQALSAKETKYKPVVSSYEKLPAAKKGGILYTDLSGNPKVMNPYLSSDNNSSTFDGLFWASLFTEDSETLAHLPYLAETYTISADRKSYTFTLRSIATWEDGSPVTTDDVKFSYDILMNPKTDAAALRAYWEGVKLDVKDKLTFTLSVPTAKFDTLRSLYLFRVISKKNFEGEADFNKAKAIMRPMGNGPYKLGSFQRDQRVEIVRRTDWWGNSVPHLKNRFNFDKIIFRLITDPNLVYERFLKGEIDVMEFAGGGLETYQQKVKGIDKDKFGTGPKSGKSLWTEEFRNKAPRGYGYVGWNLRKPMFSSKKTRQALAHLVDVQSIVDKVYFGYSYQSTSPFGSLTLNAAPELRKPGKMFGYDLKKALQLLKEDGWADSDKDNILDKQINGTKTDFKFTLKYNSNNPARGKVAQILKENFRKAGIDITIRSMEWNAFLEDVDTREYEAVILAWTATPYPNPRQTWHTDAEKERGSNFVSYSNPTVDALIEKANVETDINKRAKMLHEINRIIYDDQPYLFLTEPRSLIAGFNSKLKSPVWAMQYDVSPPVEIYSAE